MEQLRIGPELRAKEGVLLGLSGGADSTALLRVLLNAGCKVYAVHCNFHLRGDESNRDMLFCERLCRKFNVPLDILHFNVEEYMQLHSVGMEEACRNLRYAEFHRFKNKYGCRRIAVAHNADDNIETLMLNLFRGSGIRGLRGMLPDTGTVVRPLLEVSRKEIIEYLTSIGQDYIIDSTNLESDVKRNFIRNELLPLAETRWPGLRKAVTTTLRNLRGDEKIIEAAERELLGSGEKPAATLTYLSIKEAPDAEWIIHRWGIYYGLNPHSAGEISNHIEAGTLLPGKKWTADNGYIYATQEGLEYIPNCNDDVHTEYEVSALCDIREVSLTEKIWKEIKSNRSNDILWLSAPASRYIMRRPIAGDRISSLGMKGSQLVADILRDSRQSLSIRKNIKVLCCKDTGEVIWVPGLKRSRHHLLGGNDKKAWRIELADKKPGDDRDKK